MDEENLKERDFQRYTGWKVPLVIKIAWFGLLIWIASYIATYLVPSIIEWNK